MKKFKFTINGSKYEVNINDLEQDVAEIEVNGTPFTVEIEREKKTIAVPTIKKAAGRVAPIATPTASATKATTIKAPLPGSIMKVLVSAGQSVKRGDVLLTMESMKMENSIMAETDGVIKAVHVAVGQNVMQDDALIEMESTETAAPAPTAATPKTAEAKSAAPATPKPAAGGATETIKAPLPGSIMKVLVSAGQNVKRGDTFLTMESMKMENSIMAERDCVVKNVHVSVGQNVMQDDALVDIE